MITGVWRGYIDNQKVEVKMVQNGDSIIGTAYYYQSGTNYRRYLIKGYIDETDNSVVWWDDQLLEEGTKGLNVFSRKKPTSSRADVNCPGDGVMKLDGKMYLEQEQKKPRGDVHLNKVGVPSFKDEWDYVIENYTVGSNDPTIIDSVSSISQNPVNTGIEEKPITVNDPIVRNDEPVKKEVVPISSSRPENKTDRIDAKISPPTIEQKFVSREKVFTKEIPVFGDSIELRFYDNAEIDGDSISLFLNGRLIFEHIRLSDKAYIIKFSVNELQENNELIMVAENLGAIPPNTSLMVTVVGDKRYEAQLASTENSSAMIKFVKKKSENELKQAGGQ